MIKRSNRIHIILYTFILLAVIISMFVFQSFDALANSIW